MSTPSIAVRLSPEGVADVIDAFRRVTAEGKKLDQQNSSKNVTLLNQSLRDLKRLIPTIGIATVVGGFIAMSRTALKAAEDTGKLQQSFGGLVEEISGLTLAFRTNKSDQAGLQQALAKTSTLMSKVRGGSQEALDSLASIGLGADVANLTTPRALEAIAKRLVAIEDPGKRAAAAIAIFRDRTGQLLPALNAVGKEGIDQFIRKARELGVLIDDDLAAAASRANDALGLVKISAEGLAVQFSSGLAPAVADAMETFTDAVTGEGISGMEKFGQAVGFVVKLVIGLFTGMGQTIALLVAQTATTIGTIWDVGKNVLTLNFKGAKDAVVSGVTEILAIQTAANEDMAKLVASFLNPPKRDPKDPAGGGEDPNERLELLRKQNAARLQLRQQQARLELQIQLELLKSEEEAVRNQYEADLISLQRYFDARLDITKRASAAEIAALKKERAALTTQLGTSSAKGGPEDDEARARIRLQIAQIDAQIRSEEISGAREIASLDAERAQALKALSKEREAQNIKLLEAEGNRHAVFLANLGIEIRQLRELGARAGQSAADIEATVERLTRARTSQFNFEEVSRRAKDALLAFQRDADQIRRDQQSGVIGQIEGEQRLIELERQRLVILQAIAQEALRAAQATGNPEAIEQAQAYADSVAQIAASYHQATNALGQFRSAGIEAVGEGVSQLASNIDKIKSVGDAFNQLADTVKSALAEIAAEIIKRQIILALSRLIPGVGIPGAKYGGRIRGMATGGDVTGPKLPIAGPDKIPILAQEGEFMLRKKRVGEPGALAFLHAWNDGRFTLAQAMRMPHFADGGVIGSASAAQMATRAGAAGGAVNMHFNFPSGRGERVSRLTLMQVQAAAAQGLAEASRRNN